MNIDLVSSTKLRSFAHKACLLFTCIREPGRRQTYSRLQELRNLPTTRVTKKRELALETPSIMAVLTYMHMRCLDLLRTRLVLYLVKFLVNILGAAGRPTHRSPSAQDLQNDRPAVFKFKPPITPTSFKEHVKKAYSCATEVARDMDLKNEATSGSLPLRMTHIFTASMITAD